MKLTLQAKQDRRTRRVRKSISGTSDRPRLVVTRSSKHVHAQLVDDIKGVTLLAVSDLTLKMKGTKREKAWQVGKLLAAKAKKKGITKVVFDRRHYQFHGRVAAVAEGAREQGLEV